MRKFSFSEKKLILREKAFSQRKSSSSEKIRILVRKFSFSNEILTSSSQVGKNISNVVQDCSISLENKDFIIGRTEVDETQSNVSVTSDKKIFIKDDENCFLYNNRCFHANKWKCLTQMVGNSCATVFPKVWVTRDPKLYHEGS